MMIGAKKHRSVFVCQITDAMVKAVRCVPSRGSTRPSAEVHSLAIPPGADDAAVAAALREVLGKLGFDRHPLIISLPRQLAAVRYLKLPTQDPQEIGKIISLQAPRLIPYSADELICGFEQIGVDPAGYSGLIVTIVHKDIVERYRKLTLHLKPERVAVALSSYGIRNFLPFIPGAAAQGKPVLAVDLDAGYAEAAVIGSNKMLMSRAFRCNREAGPWEAAAADECAKTVQAYLDEVAGEKPVKAFVLGQAASAEALAAQITRQTGIPAQAYAPGEAVHMPEASAAGIAASGISFSGLIGLGLKELDQEVNLMPRQAREEEGARSRYQARLQRAGMAAGIILVFLAASAILAGNKERYLSSLKGELSRISKEAKPLDNAEKRFKLLKGYSKNRFSSLDVLYELHRIMPAEVSLLSFTYEDGSQVALRGQALQLQDVFTFVTAIQGAPAFKPFTVKVRYATKRKVFGGEVVDFEILCAKEG